MELLKVAEKNFPGLFLLFSCISSDIFLYSVCSGRQQHIRPGSAKEQDALEQALKNSAVRAYAMTGEYPEDLCTAP